MAAGDVSSYAKSAEICLYGEDYMEIREVSQLDKDLLSRMAELLVAVVDDGASVGFLPPMEMAEAERYWLEVPGPHVRLWVLEAEGRVEGTVQLQLSPKPNATHRAEVAKLLVHPGARRRGYGRRLMLRLETEARRLGRTLLVLDTREGDPSNDLYLSLGYQVCGRVPRYARSADGTLDASLFYYKELSAPEGVA